MSSTLFSGPLRRLPRRLALAAGFLGVLALAALPAASAQAATSTVSDACGLASVSQPFAQWGDSNLYELVSGGDFEGSLTGWTFTGGAGTVAGSEPFAVTGALGQRSLSLPNGSTAQTPYTCVVASDYTFRFVTQDSSLFGSAASPSSILSVSVVYRTALGPSVVYVGELLGDSTWVPSPALQTLSAVESAISPNGTAQMAIRFTSLGGTSHVDDVFIDPRMKG
jgi:hypothetical protein